jgi:TctA family transporter
MSQGLYLVGFIIVIAGVAYMAHLMHLPDAWIGAIVLVLLGVGVVSMVNNTRHRDPS